MDEGGGVREEGERLSVKEEGSGGELGSDLDLDPDPWKILWIRQNDADPLDPDPQHCLIGIESRVFCPLYFHVSKFLTNIGPFFICSLEPN